MVKTSREDGERVTLWIINSSLSFGWQKMILTNWVRSVMSLFVVSLPRLINFPQTQTKSDSWTQNAPVYIQNVS